MQAGPAAELVMRLRRATDMPVIQCKDFLSAMRAEDRERIVQKYEAGAPFFLWYRSADDPTRLRELYTGDTVLCNDERAEPLCGSDSQNREP